MKYEILAIVLIVLVSYFSGYAQNNNLHIEINGITSIEGKLMIGIFDNAGDFKSKINPVYKASVLISDSSAGYTFNYMFHGSYAVAIYHDVNENSVLDVKKLGIPIEGVGFSGSQTKGFKPPDFDAASFRFSNDTTVSIQIKYPKKKVD